MSNVVRLSIVLLMMVLVLPVVSSAAVGTVPSGMKIVSEGVNSALVSTGGPETYWFYKTNNVVNGWYTYNVRVYTPKMAQTDYVLTGTTLTAPTTVSKIKSMMPYVCRYMKWPRCDLYPRQVWT